MDIQNRHIVNYTTANGLLSNEFMGGACCKRKSGELVFGSNEGIVSFDPVQLTDGLRKIPESLRITNLTIGDSREKQGLQVGFIAFDYSHPRSIRYRYRLDGYDTDWREVDASDRTAIYNLSGSFLLGGGRGGLFCWYSWLYAYCCVSPIRAGCAGINFAKPSWSVRYKNVHGC